MTRNYFINKNSSYRPSCRIP